MTLKYSDRTLDPVIRRNHAKLKDEDKLRIYRRIIGWLRCHRTEQRTARQFFEMRACLFEAQTLTGVCVDDYEVQIKLLTGMIAEIDGRQCALQFGMLDTST
jgi:hypothetical protein